MNIVRSTVVLIGLASAVAGAALYFGWPGRDGSITVDASVPASPPVTEGALNGAAETRRLAMQVAYADLEKDRLLLNRQLGALNAKLWGLRVPAARAHSIQSDMMAAKSLITNPPLLGAFEDTAAITRERERVGSALARLEEIETALPADTGGR